MTDVLNDIYQKGMRLPSPTIMKRFTVELEAIRMMDHRTPLQISEDRARLFRLDSLYIPMMIRWKALQALAEMQQQGVEIIL